MATRSSVARARLPFGRERTPATGPRRGVLLDRGRRDQVVRVRCGAGGSVSRLRSHARDRLPHSSVAPSLERSHRPGRGGVRCRGASVRVRQQADHGREQRVSSGDEPANRRRPGDWLVVISLGVFQLGLAYVSLSRAIGRISALDASLFLLAEPVLSPLWAWLVHRETPGPMALVGGAVLLGATAAKSWRDSRLGAVSATAG